MVKPIIFTVGHSTHPIGEFIGILQAHGIKQLVDVRTIPRSRHNPQFNEDVLAKALAKEHITYHSMKSLGGLRHAKKDSVNMGWRNASFRGYADYMQTEAFEEAIEALIDLSKKKPTVIMCAESVSWRCHRSLIADALTVRKIPVMHIMSGTHAKPHEMTAFAEVKGKYVVYPAATDLFSIA